MRRTLQLAAGVAIAAAAATGGAQAQDGGGGEYSFGLSSRQVASPSGMSIRVRYRDPRNPEGKPPPLEAVALSMPPGLRFNTRAVPACHASDEELRSRGRDACPPRSRIGSGALTAMTGVPGVDPVDTDLTIFNGGDQLIELVSFEGSNVTAGFDRLRIRGGRLVADPPATPGGPPDGRTTVREIAFRIGVRSFVTTPPRCPAGGQWRSRLTFKFASYPRASNVDDATPCTPSTRAGRAPRMRVSVRPRRVRAGRRARIRIRVRSSSPACRRGVRVRLGGRRVRTNRRGRARIALRFRRRGVRRVRAAKRGCRSARARLRVR